MKTEKSAGVVVFRKTEDGIRYLLMENSSKFFWDFPKGNIEQDETEESAAYREMVEEAGLEKVKIIPGFKEPMNYFYRFKGDLIDKRVVMFVGEEKENEEVKLSWEHSKFEWVSIDDAKKMLKQSKKQLIEKVHDFLSGRLENWTN